MIIADATEVVGGLVLLVMFIGFVIAIVIAKRNDTARKRGQPAKPTLKATVKPQAPTEEELLLAMSDTELLRELVRLQRMSLQSQQSQTRVSRLGIFGFLALFSGGE